MSKWSDMDALRAYYEHSAYEALDKEFNRFSIGRAILDLRERAEKADQRCAALEAALRGCADTWYGGLGEHADEFEKCWEEHNDAILSSRAALSGDTSALRDMLELAATAGAFNAIDGSLNKGEAADIAKRVMEGR